MPLTHNATRTLKAGFTIHRWLSEVAVTFAVVPGMTQWEGAVVVLREIEDGDLDGLFEQMRDPESVRMAAFVSWDPNDREAFDAHMARVRSAPGNAASIRVLQKAGFRATGTEISYANARGAEIEETILRLD